MITQKHRFRGHGSLKYVYSRGRTVRGPLFSVKSILNDRRSSYRVAIVVSRKVHKSAVKRNRIRRRLYELIRQLDSQIAGPYDMVVTIFSDQIIETESAILNQQLMKQLNEAGVIK